MRANELCVLAMDDSEVKRQQQFYLEKMNKKSKIYMSLIEYNDLLKDQYEIEQDLHNKILIQREMKEIRRELKKYYEPGMLAMYKFERHEDFDDRRTSNGRVKKISR